MDRIFIRGLQVFAHHGVLEEEEIEGQLFVLDVEVEIDLSRAGAGDRLEDTVDYARLSSRIHRLVSSTRWNLIEKVAAEVASLVLEDPRVHAVEVTVRKPEAPLDVDVDEVAVHIRRP